MNDRHSAIHEQVQPVSESALETGPAPGDGCDQRGITLPHVQITQPKGKFIMLHGFKHTLAGFAGSVALAGTVFLPLAASLGGFTPASAQITQETATLRFELTGFDGQTGLVSVALYADAQSWLGNGPVASARVPVEGDTVTVVFEGLVPGQYAAVAYHDINANGELDTGMMRIPTEPIGYSAGARSQFGPARFDAATLSVEAGEDRAERIRLAGVMGQ